MSSIWTELGIARGSDRDTIRRAYARKLRVTNPEDDSDGFKRLRAAYEQALAQADYAARWGDEDEEDAPDEEGFTGGELTAMADPLARPDPSVRWDDTTSDTPQLSEEAIALRAARDSDLAALHSRMADLDGAVRGVWRAPDADLEALFAEILAAPALGEIAVRGDVEGWAAQLIADTIPRSDAILAQAVTAFGWSEHQPHAIYAVYDVLARLDEWRLIAALGKPAHALNPAWRSLTKPPVWQPWWRIKALSPGLARGVHNLLGEFGYVSSGLHFSFNAAALGRWRAHFAKPRLTLGMVLLAFAVWIGVHFALAVVPQLHGRVPYAVGALVAAASLAAPWLALAFERRRHARAAAGVAPSHLLRSGWIAAYVLLGIGAVLLPATPVTAIMVTLAGLVVLGWIVVAADPAEHTPFWPSAGRWLIGGWLYAVLGLPVAARLVPPAQLTLGVVVVLAVLIRTTMVEQARRALDRFAPTRPAPVGASAVAAILIVGALATWARLALYRGDVGALFLGGSLTLLAALPWLALFGPRYVRWIAAAHIAAMLAFFVLAAPLLPDTRNGGSQPDRSHSADAFSRQRLLEAERRQFADIKRYNPQTYAEIDATLVRFYHGILSSDAANKAVAAALDRAYRKRLPDASTALLVEERRVALAQLRELRAIDSAACAAGKLSALKTLSPGLGTRSDALIRAIAATPPASLSDRRVGAPVSPLQQVRGAALKLGKPVDRVIAALNDREQPAFACAVRVTMMEALLTHPDADVAATVRARHMKKAASE